MAACAGGFVLATILGGSGAGGLVGVGGEGIADIESHPWWRGRVSRSNLTRLIATVENRSRAAVFFNQAGEHIAIDDWAVTEDPFAGPTNYLASLSGVYSVANMRHQARERLGGGDIKVVVIRMRAGDRLNHSRATAAVHDAVLAPSQDDISREVGQFWKQVDDLVEQADRKK